MKKALITGVAGQECVYLVELLLEKGYEVHGIKRHYSLLGYRRSLVSCELVFASHPCFYLHYADVSDSAALSRIMREVEPDEIYNLGVLAFSSVPFETSEQVAELNGLHTQRMLEAASVAGLTRKVRMYQNAADVQELKPTRGRFHSNDHKLITAKLSSHAILSKYRSNYNMYACNGFISNYRLAGRGETFLPRKITQGAVRTTLGLQGLLYLDSLDTFRDWGHAQDYAEAMWRVLQQPSPADYVIATGIFTTVREFVRLVFLELGIDIVFQGEGVREVGYVVACYNSSFSLMPGQSIVAIDPIHYHPSNVENYLAESSKARRQLGWKPRYDLRTLVQEMVQDDLRFFQKDSSLTKFASPALSPVT